MAIKEIGQGSATSVELDADPGLIKNSDGETVISITADQDVLIATAGALTYKSKTIATAAANTDLTLAQSGATVLLTGSGTARLPAITTAASVGVQYVIANLKTGDITGAIVRDVGGTASFYDSDTTGGETAAQDVGAMKAKTVIAAAVNQWLVIG